MRSFYGRTGIEFRDEITENLVRLSKRVREEARNAVLMAAGIVQEKAHDYANVSPGETGNAVDGTHMRDNVEIGVIETPTAIEARIGIDLSIVPYAPHQEFGPHGNAFLRRAMDDSRDECHEIMQSVLIDGVEPHTLVRFRRYA